MKIGALGEFVARRRKALGVTQGELAEISLAFLHILSNVESGNGNPTLGRLFRVTAALGRCALSLGTGLSGEFLLLHMERSSR